MKRKGHQVESFSHLLIVDVAFDVAGQRWHRRLRSFREDPTRRGIEGFKANGWERVAATVSAETLSQHLRVKHRVDDALPFTNITHFRGQELRKRRLLLHEIAERNLRVAW